MKNNSTKICKSQKSKLSLFCKAMQKTFKIIQVSFSKANRTDVSISHCIRKTI
jgi:transcriptional regulator